MVRLKAIVGAVCLLIGSANTLFSNFRAIEYLQNNAPWLYAWLAHPIFQITLVITGCLFAVAAWRDASKKQTEPPSTTPDSRSPAQQTQGDRSPIAGGHMTYVGGNQTIVHQTSSSSADGERGRPDVIFSSRYLTKADHGLSFKQEDGFYFFVQNVGEHAAVNLKVLPIRIPIPERVVQARKEEQVAFGFSGDHGDTEWVISFDSLDHLTRAADPTPVLYRIAGNGPLQQNIAGILPHLIDWSAKATLPVVVEFSNLAEPRETFHVHYELEYTYSKPPKLANRFVGYGTCDSTGRCERC